MTLTHYASWAINSPMMHRKQRRAEPVDRSKLRLKCDYVALDSLKLNPRNARIHAKEQIQRIADSIREHGRVFPIVVDKSGLINDNAAVAAEDDLACLTRCRLKIAVSFCA